MPRVKTNVFGSTIGSSIERVVGESRTTVDFLRQVWGEEIWLQNQRSPQTRRAYQSDIRHFNGGTGTSLPGRTRPEVIRNARATGNPFASGRGSPP